MTYLPDQSSFQQPFKLERQARFLETLALSGNVRACCRAVGIGPNTAYRWRRASADFARLWDAAMVSARAHAEQVLADRALNGIEEPVFYHGEEIARRRRYSDRLLLAHLARLDAKADDPALAGIATDFDTALEEFAATGACSAVNEAGNEAGNELGNEPVNEAADDLEEDAELACASDGASNGACEGADGRNRPPPEHPWDDETVPLVERALLYLEAQEAARSEEPPEAEEEAEEGPDEVGDDGAPDPSAFLV
ncbi:hypothetical protein HKD42_06570 [Altererythrobacter sp. RZ02]|uniref:Homeodomain phBC6A51-type domain-containing protein n=1 Tax=Pontixanthobacter rizhaonensis TaxID=2730337 RepID=A0A848QLK8_9SPHN|nr:hypothetical protein [Pontixanthobacter rizhaonensis]NMW31719.1 hypothetical protein [Pontixanthobacter rizhaonensis]